MSSFKLSPGVTQLRQAHRCLQELEMVQVNAAQIAGPPMSEELTELMQYNSRFVETHSLDEVAQALRNSIQSAITYEVVIAIEPSAVFLQELTRWFRDNLSPQVLISYKVRRSIGGGAIVRTPNRIYDFSFYSKLLASNVRIGDILHHV